jgi:hypothetical protein
VIRHERAFKHRPDAQDECIVEVTADNHHPDRKTNVRRDRFRYVDAAATAFSCGVASAERMSCIRPLGAVCGFRQTLAQRRHQAVVRRYLPSPSAPRCRLGDQRTTLRPPFVVGS